VSVGIKFYSVRDVLCDVSNKACPAKWRYVSHGKWCQRSLWQQIALASCEFRY